MKKLAASSVLLACILAAVVSYTGTGFQQDDPYGYIRAEVVQEVPQNAPVTNTSSLDYSGSNKLQRLINESIEHPHTEVSIVISSKQVYEQIQRVLTNEMLYVGPDKPGWYIKKNGYVIRIKTEFLL